MPLTDPRQEDGPARGGRDCGPRVLLIGAGPAGLAPLRELLEVLGCRVRTVPGAADAERLDAPDLLVADLGPPGGAEMLVRRLRRREDWDAIPIIGIGEGESPPAAVTCRLSKPVSPRALRRAIARLLDRSS